MKLQLTVFVAALSSALVSPVAQADETYSTLGPCNGVNSFSGCWGTIGSLLLGEQVDIGQDFTATATGPVNSLRLAVTALFGFDEVTIRLFADDGNAVGSQIGSDLPYNVGGNDPFGGVPVSFIDASEAGWNVVAGQKYWIVMFGGPNSWSAVWENTQNITGTKVVFYDGVLTEDSYELDSTLGAMAIDVGPASGCEASPTITTQPADVTTCPTGIATFSVDFAGDGPFQPLWEVLLSPEDGGGWLPLEAGNLVVSDVTMPGHNLVAGVVGCAGGATMTFTPNIRFKDAFVNNQTQFRCTVANACGGVTSDPAFFTICPADFDCDGFVSGDDFDAYVAQFELGNIAADFDHDGFVTGDDFDAYVIAFEGGC